MRDPRLHTELVETRQQMLIEQAAGDRLAASQHMERRALGHMLAALGRALLNLRMRLRLGGDPASSAMAGTEDVMARNGRCPQANGHHPVGTEAASQAEGPATATAMLVEVKSGPKASKACW